MKRLLLIFGALFVVTSAVQGHPQPPIGVYIQSSRTVCIVKAVRIDKEVVTFSVEEIVKGTPPKILKLTIAQVPAPITWGSEWLLASTRSSEASVGWEIEGDDGWVNAPIRRINGKAFLVGNYGYVEPSIGSDTVKGMTLEQLKGLASGPRVSDIRTIMVPQSH